MEKELTAAEVRKLPEAAKVTVHRTDKYGYPCKGDYFVHEMYTGEKVLLSLNPNQSGFTGIANRKGTKYTIETGDDGNSHGT